MLLALDAESGEPSLKRLLLSGRNALGGDDLRFGPHVQVQLPRHVEVAQGERARVNVVFLRDEPFQFPQLLPVSVALLRVKLFVPLVVIVLDVLPTQAVAFGVAEVGESEPPAEDVAKGSLASGLAGSSC